MELYRELPIDDAGTIIILKPRRERLRWLGVAVSKAVQAGLAAAACYCLFEILRRFLSLQDIQLTLHQSYLLALAGFAGYLTWRVIAENGLNLTVLFNRKPIAGLVTEADANNIIFNAEKRRLWRANEIDAEISNEPSAMAGESREREMPTQGIVPDAAEWASGFTKKGEIVVPIRRGVHSVGRSYWADISLENPYISDIHAQIIARSKRLDIIDAGSTNGTFINGSRIDAGCPVMLAEGDRVVFGKDCSFQLRFYRGFAHQWLYKIKNAEDTRWKSITQPLVIGREAGNQVAAESPLISRRHCLVTPATAGLLVEDLHSSNGSYRWRRLKPGKTYCCRRSFTLRLGPARHHQSITIYFKRKKFQ